MRTQSTITDLSPAQWTWLQEVVLTEYVLPMNQPTVCATFVSGTNERHVEMPFRSFVPIVDTLASIAVGGFRRLARLPSAEEVRNLTSADAVELTKLLNTPCEHGSQVVSHEPSQFDGAPPVRTHSDGCQSYGPYAETEEVGSTGPSYGAGPGEGR